MSKGNLSDRENLSGKMNLTIHSNQMWSYLWWDEALCAFTEHAGDPHFAIAKEIVLAITFAESYIVEWTLGVLHDRGQPDSEFDKVFPPDDRMSSTDDRWKRAPQWLLEQGYIDGVLDRSDSRRYKEWKKLLEWRHWLVHAAASRPNKTVDGKPEGDARLDEFQKLEHGWALSVVAEQVCRLNEAAGTKLPQALAGLPQYRAR